MADEAIPATLGSQIDRRRYLLVDVSADGNIVAADAQNRAPRLAPFEKINSERDLNGEGGGDRTHDPRIKSPNGPVANAA